MQGNPYNLQVQNPGGYAAEKVNEACAKSAGYFMGGTP
jgi:hypothetical protein